MRLNSRFNHFGFRIIFFRSRLKEIRGDFAGAAALLARANPPTNLISLTDAYRLRMLVLASDPKNGPEIMKSAKEFDWYRAPASAGDEYASTYCRYFEAGIRGDGDLRQHFREKLARLRVTNVYRDSLRIT